MSYKPQPTMMRPHGDSVTGDSEQITVSGTAQASAAMPATVDGVRLSFHGSTGSVPCYISIGKAPVVTAAKGAKLLCNSTEYFKIAGGEKVSVIGTDGQLTVTPVTK